MAVNNEMRPRPRPGGARPLPPSPQPQLAELPADTTPLNIRPKTPTQRLQVPGLGGSRPSTPKRPVTPILSLKIPIVNGRNELPLDSTSTDPASTAPSSTAASNTSDSPSDINARTVRPRIDTGGTADHPSDIQKLKNAINDISIREKERGRQKGNERSQQAASQTASDQAASDEEEQVPGYGGENWSDDDFEDIGRLGEGAGGAVYKVKDRRSNLVMARKTIPTRTTPAIQLIRELSFMSTDHANIIVFHGAYISPSSSEVKVLMEVCEGGSLDAVGKKVRDLGRRISEKVAGKLAEGIFSGLAYLHTRRIVHRDIKPSNVLLSKKGIVKLCDFGVSGELVESYAGTFTGTGYYMAPERIQGQKYTIRSDVWSSGLTLLELAMNRFPYPDDLDNPIELMSFIVRGEIPQLQDEEDCTWSQEMKDFIKVSLTISAVDRPTPKEMLEQKWLVDSASVRLNMARWIREVWGWQDPPKTSKKSRSDSSRHRVGSSQDLEAAEIPPWETPPVPVMTVN